MIPPGYYEYYVNTVFLVIPESLSKYKLRNHFNITKLKFPVFPNNGNVITMDKSNPNKNIELLNQYWHP